MTTPHISALLTAVGLLGSNAALARELGISKASVGSWLAKGSAARPVPPKQCVRIEAITKGAVTRQSLRPDDWHELWPELAVNYKPKPTETPASSALAATETVAQGVA